MRTSYNQASSIQSTAQSAGISPAQVKNMTSLDEIVNRLNIILQQAANGRADLDAFYYRTTGLGEPKTDEKDSPQPSGQIPNIVNQLQYLEASMGQLLNRISSLNTIA